MGINVKNISKSVDGDKILDIISCEVYDSHFAILLAPTGDRKTNLLDIMAGSKKPGSGRVFYDYTDVTTLSDHKGKISIVSRKIVNHPSMTVFHNIAAPY